MPNMQYFAQFKSKGIPFMDGRTKGDLKDLYGQPVHITDFAKLENDEGEYPVFVIAEDEAKFYFGNSVIKDMLDQIEKDDMRGALAEVAIVFSSAVSKKGRTYTAFDFITE